MLKIDGLTLSLSQRGDIHAHVCVPYREEIERLLKLIETCPSDADLLMKYAARIAALERVALSADEITSICQGLENLYPDAPSIAAQLLGAIEARVR